MSLRYPAPDRDRAAGLCRLRERTAVLLREDAVRDWERWRQSVLDDFAAQVAASENSMSLDAPAALREFLAADREEN